LSIAEKSKELVIRKNFRRVFIFWAKSPKSIFYSIRDFLTNWLTLQKILPGGLHPLFPYFLQPGIAGAKQNVPGEITKGGRSPYAYAPWAGRVGGGWEQRMGPPQRMNDNGAEGEF
jgi:hypothetical protein